MTRTVYELAVRKKLLTGQYEADFNRFAAAHRMAQRYDRHPDKAGIFAERPSLRLHTWLVGRLGQAHFHALEALTVVPTDSFPIVNILGSVQTLEKRFTAALRELNRQLALRIVEDEA